jgi:hypothetical protein
LPHVWHAACNTAFMTWFLENKPELDDRQKNDKTKGRKVSRRRISRRARDEDRAA